ncbi:MAG TPA: alpha/beta hydrolase [Gemmatimonadaceae bacterium]
MSLPLAVGAQSPADTSSHTTRFVNVAPNVRLETVDWGGRGRPVVLLAGAGNTAHIFDQLAPKLTSDYHVYGITRRGFGNSTITTSGFLSDSLADDVVAVIDSLGIRRPVLIGHSIAGQELSSIGSRHPEKVAGLVYLDAGAQFAFYDSAETHVGLTLRDASRKLTLLADPGVAMTVAQRAAMIDELLASSLPLLERDLRVYHRALATAPNQSAVVPAPQRDSIRRALAMGTQKYTKINGPVLAIFAHPPETPPAMAVDSASRARADSLARAALGPHIDNFERGVPQARVVRIPHANHYVFRSNEAEVVREIRAFIGRLP